MIPDISGPGHCTWPGCGKLYPVSSLARKHEVDVHLSEDAMRERTFVEPTEIVAGEGDSRS